MRGRILGATLVMLLLPLLAAACGGGDGEPPLPAADAEPTAIRAAASGEPKGGGTLRVALVADANTLDPALSVSTADNTITLAVYDNLVLRQPDHSLKPMLAKSWEANDDLTRYTFHLRSGVKFHHGKEFKAEDVVFTFERLLDPDTESPARSALDFITDIVAIDDLTVRFDLAGPNAFLPDTLSLYQGRIIPSDVEPDRLATEEFGTGPFVITEHVPGERSVLERNPEYWEAGRPYVDKVIFFYIPDPETRLEALKTGAVDVVRGLSGMNASRTEAHPETTVLEVASGSYINLTMDRTVAPFDDKRVRQAMQAVTDREAILREVLLGRGVVANDHPIPPNDPHYWEGQEIRAHDVGRAKALLEEAGYPDGIDVTLHTSTIGEDMVELAVAFKRQAAPAGIRVSVERASEEDYWSDVWMHEPFTTVTWNGRNADQALSIVYKSDAEWNESKIDDPLLDELILKARSEGDLAERKATYAEIQRMLTEDAGRIIPVFRSIMVGVRNSVHGVEAHPSNWLILTEAWLD